MANRDTFDPGEVDPRYVDREPHADFKWPQDGNGVAMAPTNLGVSEGVKMSKRYGKRLYRVQVDSNSSVDVWADRSDILDNGALVLSRDDSFSGSIANFGFAAGQWTHFYRADPDDPSKPLAVQSKQKDN
jgi:hypothetical protein